MGLTKMSPLMERTAGWRRAGFTLIELVMVIVLLAIVGGMGAQFISQAFLGFKATDARMEIYEEGKMILVRLEREIRNGLPNAVTLVSGQELRFGLIDEQAVRQYNLFGQYSEAESAFPSTTLTDVDGAATPQTGWVVSLYNLSWSDFNTGSKLFQVSGVSGSQMSFGGALTDPSPRQRYYVVDKAVRYLWSAADKTLYRSEASVSAGGVGAFGTQYPLAVNVSALTFQYASGTLTRNGMVIIDLTCSKEGESVTFHKEIHIKNVP